MALHHQSQVPASTHHYVKIDLKLDIKPSKINELTRKKKKSSFKLIHLDQLKHSRRPFYVQKLQIVIKFENSHSKKKCTAYIVVDKLLVGDHSVLVALGVKAVQELAQAPLLGPLAILILRMMLHAVHALQVLHGDLPIAGLVQLLERLVDQRQPVLAQRRLRKPEKLTPYFCFHFLYVKFNVFFYPNGHQKLVERDVSVAVLVKQAEQFGQIAWLHRDVVIQNALFELVEVDQLGAIVVYLAKVQADAFDARGASLQQLIPKLHYQRVLCQIGLSRAHFFVLFMFESM
jgi:hypothetical protein